MASGAAVLVEPRGCESSVGVVSKQYMTGEIGKRGNNSFCQLCPKGKKMEGWQSEADVRVKRRALIFILSRQDKSRFGCVLVGMMHQRGDDNTGKREERASVVTLCWQEGGGLMRERRGAQTDLLCQEQLGTEACQQGEVVVGVYGFSLLTVLDLQKYKADYQLRMRLGQEVWKVERKRSL